MSVCVCVCDAQLLNSIIAFAIIYHFYSSVVTTAMFWTSAFLAQQQGYVQSMHPVSPCLPASLSASLTPSLPPSLPPSNTHNSLPNGLPPSGEERPIQESAGAVVLSRSTCMLDVMSVSPLPHADGKLIHGGPCTWGGRLR